MLYFLLVLMLKRVRRDQHFPKEISELVQLVVSCMQNSPGKKCFVLEQTKELFPLNDRKLSMQTRNQKIQHTPCQYRKVNKLYSSLHKENVKKYRRKPKLVLTHSALLLVKSCYALLIIAWLHDSKPLVSLFCLFVSACQITVKSGLC